MLYSSRNVLQQERRKDKDLFKKSRDIKGTFHARRGMIKKRNGKDLTKATAVNRIVIQIIIQKTS